LLIGLVALIGKDNAVAQKIYTTFNPAKEKWNTPILIFQGGKDFQYQLDKVKAFQAAQLLVLK
jgi:hypothetical protein